MKPTLLACALTLTCTAAIADPAHTYAFGEPGDPAKADRTVEVLLKDIAFEPDRLQVKAGETVRFVLINQGQLPHEFNLGDKVMHVEHQKQMLAMAGHVHGGTAHDHDTANTVLVMPGKRAELTWTFRGSAPIEFACNVPGHYQAGMVGPVTIE